MAIIIALLPFPSKALFGKVLLQCIGVPAELNFPDAFHLKGVMAKASASLSDRISKVSIDKTFRYDWRFKFPYDATPE